LLEALALGVPVVSTAFMGTADIVYPERGAGVAQDDEAAFADEVLRLLGNRERRAKMAQDAREFAQEWSAAAMAARLAELYASTLQARRQTDPAVLRPTAANEG